LAWNNKELLNGFREQKTKASETWLSD
jgi:hypothetical protein